MCPQPVVPCRDSKTCGEVVCHRPQRGLEVQWYPNGLNEAIYGDAHDEGDIEPVDMLVPILLRDGRFGDVRFLGVVLCVSVWL